LPANILYLADVAEGVATCSEQFLLLGGDEKKKMQPIKKRTIQFRESALSMIVHNNNHYQLRYNVIALTSYLLQAMHSIHGHAIVSFTVLYGTRKQ
jgi:hypothetical protein